MEAAGLEVRPEWRCVVGVTLEDGEAGATALMQADPSLTALLCWNDWLALGAMRELQRRGIDIPGDVSVIGFDDLEAGRWVQPALTTMQQPMSKIGNRAAEVLIRQIGTGRSEPELTLYPGDLVVRASASPPRAAAVLG